MATIGTPYGQFMANLAQGSHDLINNPLSVALLTSAYTPDFANDYDFALQSANEVPNDATSGGYTTGGTSLTNKNLTYDGAGNVITLTADSVAWPVLTATFRYAIILDSSDAIHQRMIGLLNFGTDRTYNAEVFTLAFPNGVMTISGA